MRSLWSKCILEIHRRTSLLILKWIHRDNKRNIKNRRKESLNWLCRNKKGQIKNDKNIQNVFVVKIKLIIKKNNNVFKLIILFKTMNQNDQSGVDELIKFFA